MPNLTLNFAPAVAAAQALASNEAQGEQTSKAVKKRKKSKIAKLSCSAMNQAEGMEVHVSNFRSSKTRLASLNGRQHIVAPLTLIVPGVLNGSKGALYYPSEEIGKDPSMWNHTPIVLYHPTNNDGSSVSARDPDVLSKSQLGVVLKAQHKGKLVAEGWFDIESTRRIAPQVLANLQAGKAIELSTGLFTDNEPAPEGSNHNGKPYSFIARNYRPDHLAILPDQVGACSLQDGCGVNINMSTENFNPNHGKDGRFTSAHGLSKGANSHETHTAAAKAHKALGDYHKTRGNAAKAAEHHAKATEHHSQAKGYKHGDSAPAAKAKTGAKSSDGVPGGRKSDDPVWQKALHSADKQAVSHLSSAIPGVKVHEIKGNYVHQPQVTASVSKSFTSVKQDLKTAGYSAPKMWNKADSQTFKHKETGHQITVGKFQGTGGGNNDLHVQFFPTYKLDSFKLPSSVKNSKEEIQMPMTKKQKEGVVNFLVANCDCYKGMGDVLNALPDEKLVELQEHTEENQQVAAVANAALKGFKHGDTAYKFDAQRGAFVANVFKKKGMSADEMESPTEDEGEDEETETPAKKKGKGFMAKNSEANAPRLTPEEQEDLAFARQVKNQQKDAIINRLTANVSDVEQKKRLTTNLKAKSLTELSDMALLLPAPVENHQQAEPLYFGAAGGVVNTGKAKVNKDDCLVPATLNYAEIVEELNGK